MFCWAINFWLEFGGLPKRSNGTDCKSVGYAFAGSNPAPPTNVFSIVEHRIGFVLLGSLGGSGVRFSFRLEGDVIGRDWGKCPLNLVFLPSCHWGFRPSCYINGSVSDGRQELLLVMISGCSSMAELQPSKLVVRVRFPSPAHLEF